MAGVEITDVEKKAPFVFDAKYPEDDIHQIVTTADGEVAENTDQLHRRLNNRQIQLIAIGGSIGTALFVSIGGALAHGGPGSLFLAYAIYACFLALVANGTAELTTLYPLSGGFVRHAGHFVDEAWGFMAGWNFFLYEGLIIPFEITALTTVLGFWSDNIPPWAIPIACIILYGLINILAVRAYGEAEFWLSGGKVILIFLLFGFTFVSMVGGNPKHDAYGFRYWNHPGAFAEHRSTGTLGRFEGFLACLWSASFCIVGPEYMSMVAAESKRPRVYIKAAFKTIYWRFAIFFIGGALAAGIVVAYNDPTLVGIVSGKLGGSGTAAASPYVIAMDNLRIHGLQHLVNALLVTSIFSAGNTYTYCASRSLYSMALTGKAPKVLQYCIKKGPMAGVPIYCLAVTMIFPCLSFLQVSNGSAKVLNWLINLVTAGGVITYIVMCVNFIFFYNAAKAQGLDRKSLPYCGWFQPYGAYIGLVWMIMIVTCYGYSAYAPWSTENWFIYYAMLIVAQEVYEVAARPVVKAAMEGINGTVFAYGVTSSGKTHTMHGDQNSPGIIPLAIKDVFSNIQDTPGREFLLRVSYLEIYNEVINDLLDPTGQNLRVREDNQGTYVEGIKEEVVLSPGHVLSFIAAGEEHRHVGSNNFNLFSSRSHTIFTLMIESSARGDEYDGVIFSQLNLIDLAGSESSKTETTGLRRKEGSYINKSLLTLGTVIGKLSEGKASHVPYRDSKLTRLLQSSLSGHGHVSLICTVTPASSNMEETHNTLKFASRAKRVEIYASRNKIIDEKSLIKKYQKEISCLKQELDQLRKGMLVGVNHEELMTLKQQLEEGQVKMQSRLEEEEDAKAALLSRIQKLTKLILVSSKNSIPGSRFASEDDKLNVSGSIDSENQRDSSSETSEFKLGRSSSKWNDDISQAGSVITESTQAGELVTGSKLPTEGVSLSDQMDLLVEQVKMLAGEIAFSMSTLKRLIEQSVNDPENSKTRTEIQSLECDIEDKREQMRILEQRIVESGEVSISSASLIEMQQTLMKLMTQCSEKGFELEIKSADNRILQEELQNKCLENKELQETICNLEQQLAAVNLENSYPSSEQGLSDKYIDDLEKKIQLQDIENDKLKLEFVQRAEESNGLRVQNQKLSEEASYAKELASAAAVELKSLAGEVTKLSIQNTKLEKELLTARQVLNSRSSIAQTGNVRHRKHGENLWQGRRGRVSDRESEVPGVVRNGFGTWDLDTEDLKMELQARKQREAALEAALVEKEILEDEYRKKVEEGRKREAALENDLANMWVLVSQLKKKNGATQDVKTVTERQNVGGDNMNDPEMYDREYNDPILDDGETVDHATTVAEILKEDPLVTRLKARMQEMKEKDHTYVGNADANSHVCKVCFESPTSAMLLPCRHFFLCKSCSLACAECPICRAEIADRIFVFT